jgi:hypothetical protein
MMPTSAIADVVWRAFGTDVPNYIEPFCGSLAMANRIHAWRSTDSPAADKHPPVSNRRAGEVTADLPTEPTSAQGKLFGGAHG